MVFRNNIFHGQVGHVYRMRVNANFESVDLTFQKTLRNIGQPYTFDIVKSFVNIGYRLPDTKFKRYTHSDL